MPWGGEWLCGSHSRSNLKVLNEPRSYNEKPGYRAVLSSLGVIEMQASIGFTENHHELILNVVPTQHSKHSSGKRDHR